MIIAPGMFVIRRCESRYLTWNCVENKKVNSQFIYINLFVCENRQNTRIGGRLVMRDTDGQRNSSESESESPGVLLIN